eukprot:TRINITY_DN34135_c0_g1_i1.p1 TRINITY_DN34135_c0_g1~~TRINITY_DN34135_c0_g1_i1.p1  ORF type:complete len:636 (+),score=117.32 TRINITY_DN34135_c0_g1_i1:86-1909(+)
MDLTVLPPGTDLSAIPTTVATDKDAKGKKARGPADKAKPSGKDKGGKGRKGSAVAGEESAASLQQRMELARSFAAEAVEPTIDITAFINLVVINCDSGQVLEGVVTRIPYTTLETNRNGYIVMAHGTTPQWYPTGNCKLQIMSETPLATVETRAFDAVNTRDGKYQHNSQCILFKYNVTASELAYASLFLRVVDAIEGASYTFKITRNGNEVIYEQKDTVGPIIIPNIWFYPSDKATQNKYVIEATLNPVVGGIIREKMHEASVAAFEREQKEQLEYVKTNKEKLTAQAEQQKVRAEELRASQEEVLDTPRSDGKGEGKSKKRDTKTPSDKTDPKKDAKKDAGKHKGDDAPLATEKSDKPAATWQWDPKPHPNEVMYCIRVYSNSHKLLVEEDTTLSDEISNAKLKWGRPDDGHVVVNAPKDKSKDKAAPQEALQQRLQKSKEVRERFKKNMTGLFVPQLVTDEELIQGKLPVIQEDDDTSYRTVEALEPKVVLTAEDNPIVITPELRETQQAAHKQLVKQAQDMYGQFAQERDMEAKQLMKMLHNDEQQIINLRQARQQCLQEDKGRRDKYWQAKRDEEAQLRLLSAENEPVVEEKKAPPKKGKRK